MTKWLAPGTLDAMRCYAGLPRRPDVRTFFHPAGDDGAEAADRSWYVIARTPAEDAAAMKLLVESTFGLPVTGPRHQPQ